MKIRTVKYMIKEGLANTYKNILMSLASVMMVIASLLIFGIFLMITLNLMYNLNQVEKEMEIVVFLERDIPPLEADDIEQKVMADERILKYVFIDREQAFSELAEIMDDSELIQGLTPEFLNESYRIHLKNAALSNEFAEEYNAQPGVEEINFPKEFLEKLKIIIRWVYGGSMIILSLLLIISVSIIANTIKLTVFARRKEIGIMKYIGSNDWFIRWPFIIEGMIIGLVGAAVSFVLTSYLYNALENYVNTEAAMSGFGDVLRMVTFQNIYGQILLIYVMVGVVMGAVGSIISLRKHLNV